MSRMRPPIGEFPPDKSYHIVPHHDNWNQGVICGELEKTGEVVCYDYFCCYELRCVVCGETTDVGNYDSVLIGDDYKGYGDVNEG